VGTTASGKSAVAQAVAEAHPGLEIVSVDSMSVYRGMDIGTAKPRPPERAAVPHHLLDLVDPAEEFTLRDFQGAARLALADIARRGGRALLVGGTGLYLRAVLDGLELPGRYPGVLQQLERQAAAPGGVPALHGQLERLDPVAAARIAPTNRRRVLRALEVTLGSGRPFSSFGPGLEVYPPTPVAVIGIRFDPAVIDRRIEERVARFMDQGLLEEVRQLADRPGGLSRTARQALGYRELLAHLEEGVPLGECVAAIVRRTRVYARRQWAWFRRDPRVRWVAEGDDPVALVGAAATAGWLPPTHGGTGQPAEARAHGDGAAGARLGW
jgi:tRNA dimethylallyltransferase